MVGQIGLRARLYALGSLCLLILLSSPWWWPLILRPPLLLAPMMDLTPCLLARPGAAVAPQPDWLAPCSGPGASSAHLVESTLRRLQPAARDNTPWQLGYTLQVPLLTLLRSDQNAWHVNSQALDNIVQTVADSPVDLLS